MWIVSALPKKGMILVWFPNPLAAGSQMGTLSSMIGTKSVIDPSARVSLAVVL